MSRLSAASPQRDRQWRRVGSGRPPPAIHDLSSALSPDRSPPESFSHSCLAAERDPNSPPLRALGPPIILASCHVLLKLFCVDRRRVQGAVTLSLSGPEIQIHQSGRDDPNVSV